MTHGDDQPQIRPLFDISHYIYVFGAVKKDCTEWSLGVKGYREWVRESTTRHRLKINITMRTFICKIKCCQN